jgi:Mor family transcriptional regulator
MRHKKTKHRNREIFAAFQAGQTLASLGEQYGLSVVRIRALLTEEKHRHEVSPEYFYEVMRSA